MLLNMLNDLAEAMKALDGKKNQQAALLLQLQKSGVALTNSSLQ